MSQVNELDLLALIVGLSVYVATVRLLVIGRLMGDPAPGAAKAQAYRGFLASLVPADLTILAAGTILFLKIFWCDLFGGASPPWFPGAVVWLLFIAIVILIAHHVVGSLRSLWAWVKGP